jgi:hypothetical protein
MATPKYPHIKVRLSGLDGNALTILGACRRAAERTGLPPAAALGRFIPAGAGNRPPI